MPTLELTDDDAAIIIDPSGTLQIFLPESLKREDAGDGTWNADASNHPHAIIIWTLATLLDEDKDFPNYITNRMVEIQSRDVEDPISQSDMVH